MPYMSEAELEQAIDRRVMRRLATDRAYRNAENAEEQAAREAEITREVERELGVWDGAEALDAPAGDGISGLAPRGMRDY